MNVLDILASDVKIVDATIRDGATLCFPGALLPDGRDYIAQAPAQLTPSLLREWCNSVRGEYDARQSRKENQAASDAAVRDASRAAADRATGEPNAGGGSSADDGEAGEAGLEASLKSEVARWARRERTAAEEEDRLIVQLEAVRGFRAHAAANLLKAQKVLDFFLAQSTEVEEL